MLLTDGALRDLITQKADPLLTDYDPPKSWDDKDSLVQPSSVDLHIGGIFEPGVKPGKAGSEGNPKSQLVLKTGRTAVVVTKESIHLSGCYAGFGFPPAKVSSRALLMTNPGHVDPGFNGTLNFTVINMGRDDYVLRRDDLIVTLLIFKLSAKVDADYMERRVGQSPKALTQSDIDRLSPDFIDVQRRATHIARKTLGLATAGATVLAIILGWAFNAIDKRLEGIDDIKVRLTHLEDNNKNLSDQVQAFKEQLEKSIDVDHRLTVLESKKKPEAASK